MEHRELEHLVAARALDALDPVEQAMVDAHVETCEACRRQLDELREVAGALAFVAPPEQPPAHLRARILDAAAPATASAPEALRTRVLDGAAEQSSRRRVRLSLPWRTLAVGFAAATCVLAFVTLSQRSDLDHARSQRDAQARAIDVLQERGASLVRLGDSGSALVSPRQAVLVLRDLPPARDGRTYEAWVIPPGADPIPAGTFDSGGETTFVSLEVPVGGPGATVAVTDEPAGGSAAPTTEPFLAGQV